MTVFISSTPDPSSQEEGSHERRTSPRRRGVMRGELLTGGWESIGGRASLYLPHILAEPIV